MKQHGNRKNERAKRLAILGVLALFVLAGPMGGEFPSFGDDETEEQEDPAAAEQDTQCDLWNPSHWGTLLENLGDDSTQSCVDSTTGTDQNATVLTTSIRFEAGGWSHSTPTDLGASEEGHTVFGSGDVGFTLDVLNGEGVQYSFVDSYDENTIIVLDFLDAEGPEVLRITADTGEEWTANLG